MSAETLEELKNGRLSFDDLKKDTDWFETNYFKESNVTLPSPPQVASGTGIVAPAIPASPQVASGIDEAEQTDVPATPIHQNGSPGSFDDPNLSLLEPLRSYYSTPFSPSNEGSIDINGIREYLESECEEIMEALVRLQGCLKKLPESSAKKRRLS